MRTLFLFSAIFISFASGSVLAQNDAKQSLEPQQIEALKKLKTDNERSSAPVAEKLASVAKLIYANMLAEKEDQKLRRKLSKEMHLYAGQLLDIRGQSYRDALQILNPEQRARVRQELKKPDSPADIGEVIEKLFLSPKPN